MLEGYKFINIGNENSSEEDIIVAVKENDLYAEGLEEAICKAVETNCHTQGLSSSVSDVLTEIGIEFEIIYPDRYITLD